MKRVSLKEFARILEELPEQLQGASIAGLRSAGRRMVGQVVQEIDTASPHPAVDKGQLRQSVESEDVSDGAVVGTTAPHAAAVEEGSRPHFPPVEPLIGWVVRKGFAVEGPEAEQLAFAVARAIAKNGTEPRHFFGKAWKNVQRIVHEEIDAELAALAKRIG